MSKRRASRSPPGSQQPRPQTRRGGMPSFETDRMTMSPNSQSSNELFPPLVSATLKPYSDQNELDDILRTQSTFTTMIADVKKLASRVRSALEDDSNRPASLEFIRFLDNLSEAFPAGDFAHVTPLVIALFGPMASVTGKSAAINSLLGIVGDAGQPRLAKESAAGSAGTTVIHEFLYKEHDQAHKYRQRIVYHDEAEIARIVETYADKLFRFYSHDSTYVGEEDDSSDPESVVDLRTSAEFCLAFFTSVLADLPESSHFKDVDSIKAYLSSLTEETFDIQLCHLVYWVQYAKARLPVLCYEADTVAELDRYFADTEPVWAFVSKTQTCLEHPLLRYATLADTAGHDDKDIERVQLSEIYVKNADLILLVHNISRVTSELQVTEDLKWCFRNRLLSKTVLVTTRSDEGLDKDPHPPETADQVVLDYINGKIGKALEGARSARKQKDMDLLEQYNAEKDSLNRKHNDLKVDIRRRRITLAMTSRLQDTGLGSAKLPVYCLSNTEYEKLLRMVDEDTELAQRPTINVEATGVPQLRHHIYQLSDARLLRAVIDNVIVELQRGIQDEILHETRSAHSGKARVVSLIQAFTASTRKSVQLLTQGVEKSFDSQVMQELGMMEAGHKRSGDRIVDGWDYARKAKKLFYMISRKGNPPTRPGRTWNQDIVNIFADDVVSDFEDFCDAMRVTLRSFVAESSREFKSTKHALENVLEKDASKDLIVSFARHHKLLCSRIVTLVQKFDKEDVNHLQQNTVDDSSHYSYVKKAMDPYYTQAHDIKAYGGNGCSKGSRAERLAVLRSALTDDNTNVFKDTRRLLGEEFKEKLRILERRLENMLNTLSVNVDKDVASRFLNDPSRDTASPSSYTASSSKLEDGRLEELRSVQEMLDSSVQENVNSCQAFLGAYKEDISA